eukprot:scaffold286090_cov19-Prasinocladus_malaysianus.AAC.1
MLEHPLRAPLNAEKSWRLCFRCNGGSARVSRERHFIRDGELRTEKKEHTVVLRKGLRDGKHHPESPTIQQLLQVSEYARLAMPVS